jgi:hypothetical protein
MMMTKENTTVATSANEDDGLSAPHSKSTDAHYYSRNRNDWKHKRIWLNIDTE